MACQVPVVASDCGEIPNVVGGAGLLTRPGDVAALVDALEAIRGNPDLADELGRRGRTRVLEKYTHRRIAAATGAFYFKLLAESGVARFEAPPH